MKYLISSKNYNDIAGILLREKHHLFCMLILFIFMVTIVHQHTVFQTMCALDLLQQTFSIAPITVRSDSTRSPPGAWRPCRTVSHSQNDMEIL